MLNEPKVRATLVLLVYNQRKWLKDAVAACLNQECEKIEIILSDDASNDGSYELMLDIAERYVGKHVVRVRKNEKNLGIGGHYNRLIDESTGELIVTAAGDDISLPNRVDELLKAWDDSGQKADLISSYVSDMTVSGEVVGNKIVSDLSLWDKPEKWTRKRPYVIGASHAFTKRMHHFFGPFHPDLAYEDQVMAFRASCLGGGITVKKVLLSYRQGGVSSKKNVVDTIDEYNFQKYKKNYRQLVVFGQIKDDMVQANLEHLWVGKVKNYYLKSEFILKIINEKNYSNILWLMMSSYHVGFLWVIKETIRHVYRRIRFEKRVIL
jgi:glycosyltransferase involved in cell wall biosynthesis